MDYDKVLVKVKIGFEWKFCEINRPFGHAYGNLFVAKYQIMATI